METGFPHLAESIRDSVARYGFLKQRELDERAQEDPALQRLSRDEVLFSEVASDAVAVPLAENFVEGLEFTLCTGTLLLNKYANEAQDHSLFEESPERLPF